MASSSRANSSSAPTNRIQKKKVVHRYPAFKTAIEKVFGRWSALRIAVEQGQGGKDGSAIAAWMENVTEDFFYDNEQLMGEEVSYFLGTIMNQEFNTVVEDHSLEDMGDELCSYFRLCEQKKEVELLKVLENLNMEAPKTIQCQSRTTDDDSSDEEMDDEDEDDEKGEENES